MQLIGMLDSPYVRRVAVSMQCMGIAWEHLNLSVFRNFEEIRAISPMVKVPTLVLDDGNVLVDSGLMLEYLESLPGNTVKLMPTSDPDLLQVMQWLGISLAACEKVAGLIYEHHQRPVEKQHAPWAERLGTQLVGACRLLEYKLEGCSQWLVGDRFSQADLTLAVTWTFIQLRSADLVPAGDFPRLGAFTQRMEALPEFRACPVG